MKKSLKLDYTLLAIVLTLFAFGSIALYSASTVESYQKYGTTTYYIYHQLLYGGVVGLILMYIFSKIDYHLWQKNLPAIILLAIVLLALVKIPPFGFSANGASRWIHMGPIFFQPSEFAKLAIIIYLASWVDKKKGNINNFYHGFLPALCITGLFAFFILLQPDFGTMIALISIAASMLFVSGISWKYFFWTAVAGVLGLYAFIKIEPYRVKRLATFLNPALDPKGISYQINQALLAIGAGKMFGYGYGLSRQKHNYLPESINDSVFAVVAEELGFFRVLILLGLFILFAIKGFSIAKNAPDLFGKMLAMGITSWITFQAIINIGAMVSLLPLTGIPLPFFSYGSTALIMNLTSIGILFNVSRQSSPIKTAH